MPLSRERWTRGKWWRRAGLVSTYAAAMESAAAKVRRVLPAPLGRRLPRWLSKA